MPERGRRPSVVAIAFCAAILFSLASAAASAAGRTTPSHRTPAKVRNAARTVPAYQSILPPSTFLAFGSGFAQSASALSFLSHTADVTAFAPWGFALLTDGSVAERGGGAVAPVVAAAHRAGRAVLPLFTNAFGNDSILLNAGARAAALRNLVSIVKTDGLDGVNIDFEGLSPVDRAPLVTFVQAVSRALHPLGRIVTVSVGPEWATERAQYRVYDYAALAKAADRIVIMTYDEHSNPGGPGPVAGLPWVKAALAYALTRIPAHNLYLGLADYGYNWYGLNAPTVTASQAIALAAAVGVPIDWSSAQGEPYFTYTDARGVRHVVWFEDGYSEALRIHLAEAAHIAGIALWQLGGEDPSTWSQIAAYRPAAPMAAALR